MKKSLISVATIALSAILLTSCQMGPNTLSLSKTTFKPGENIEVTYKTDSTSSTAWIGVIPSATPHGTEEGNDAADVSYVYLNGVASGTKTMVAPSTTGSFDLRLNESDAGGKELASITFKVE